MLTGAEKPVIGGSPEQQEVANEGYVIKKAATLAMMSATVEVMLSMYRCRAREEGLDV